MKLYKNNIPVCSIIIPTYNREYILERAIKSVLNQTYKNWELIIVDDGSDDRTFSLVNGYLNNSHTIRYVKTKNNGLSIALNIGIKISSGSYCTFLGSDDEYKPEHLEKRIRLLIDNPDTDLIHGGVEIIGNHYVPDKNDTTKKIHLSECVIGGTFFGKTKMFLDLGGFKPDIYSEDSDFYERAKNSYNILHVDFPTYIYHRDLEDSICNSI